jgi:hypothetical protein
VSYVAAIGSWVEVYISPTYFGSFLERQAAYITGGFDRESIRVYSTFHRSWTGKW